MRKKVRKKPSQKLLRSAFSEVYAREPRAVGRTRQTRGAKAALRQKIARALAKTRRKAK